MAPRMRNSWNSGPVISPRMAARSPSAPRWAAAYSASVGTRPAKMSAARRKVLRAGAIFTVSNSVCGVSGALSTPSPSKRRNRSMSANPGVPAGTGSNPPCATP